MPNEDVQKRREYRRKKARNRHLKIFFMFFLVFALVIGIVLSVTVLFPIKYVVANGSSLYERVQIEKSSNLIGKNIFTFSEYELEQALRKKLPYIDEVTASRKFPDTVTLKVKDAKEYAYYLVNGKYYAVSKKGNVLCEYSELPENGFEIKTDKVKCRIGQPIEYKNKKAKTTLETLITEIDSNNISIDYIDLSDMNDIKLGVMSRFKVLIGTTGFLENKTAHLVGMIKNIEEDAKGTINLSMWNSENSEGTFVRETEIDKN